MKHTIHNDRLALTAEEHGAALLAIDAADGRGLIWDGKPVWPNHAPVCFPWCASLEDGWYTAGGKTYRSDKRHGFARDLEHVLVEEAPDRLTFRLDWPGDETLWPWAYTLETSHILRGEQALTVCTATNRAQTPMPTQLGFHPAFVCPFLPGTKLEEYRLRFEKGIEIPLQSHLFDQDSIPFGNVGKWCRLEHLGTGKYIQVATEGFYKTLLWSKPGIPGFVCIEPWDGFAGHQHQMEDRPGAILLAPGESKTWTLEMTFAV